MTVGGTVVNAGRDIVRLSMGRRRPQRKAKVREQPQKVCRGCCSRSLLERETVKAFSWAANGVFSSPIHSGGEAGTPKTDMSAYNSNGRIRVVSSASRPPSIMQALAIKMETLLWRRRAQNWDQEGSLQLTPVVAAVLDRCKARDGMIAVDLGCGSGQVTLPLARQCLHVLAVDLSEAAIELLKARAEHEGVGNVHALTQPIETFELAPESVDLVVSNYALHHLRDREKADLVRRSFRWLRPDGRIVIGDMMLGRGASREDRAVIADKVRALAKRGPAGWWRILKNAWRFAFRLQEKTLSRTAWEALVREAGFADVRVNRVLAEAGVVSARRPDQRSGLERDLRVFEPVSLEQQR